MTETFDADWLAAREPFDAAARSVGLAGRLAASLPARPRLLDLGAGTGSLFRWLAPVIGRAQVWTLADADADLLDAAFIECAAWGADQGFAATFPGSAHNRALLLHTPRGAWRVEAMRVNLADMPEALPLGRFDAVVCSALLDLVSYGWLERFCAALPVPLLACLSVDGRDAFLPCDAVDRIVRRGFRLDQGRAKGLGPALGRQAPRVLHALLTARGFRVTSAASDWRIPRAALPMLRALVQSHADVATRHLPAWRGAIEGWARTRLRQIETGRLAIRVGHRDSLAEPPSND